MTKLTVLKIQEAEYVYVGKYPTFPLGTPNSVHAYLGRIQRKAWWRNNYPTTHLLYREVSGSYNAYQCSPSLSNVNGIHSYSIYAQLPTHRLGILHQATHVLTNSADHDIKFVKMYLELVKRFHGNTMSQETMRGFKKELIAQGVKTKEVSAETKDKMRDAWLLRNKVPTREELIALHREVMEMES